MRKNTVIGRPEPSEAEPYYFTYIDRVAAEDIVGVLSGQLEETLVFCSGISEEQSLQRYADDKWSLLQVLNHVTDSERVFALRAFWFARGLQTPLPSYDQDIAARGAEADGVPWAAHLEEFQRVRLATVSLFENMPAPSWTRTGIASDNRFTVRSLAYIIAGHLDHHIAVLQQRYLKS